MLEPFRRCEMTSSMAIDENLITTKLYSITYCISSNNMSDVKLKYDKLELLAEWIERLLLQLNCCRHGFDFELGQTNDLKIGTDIHSFPAWRI